MLSGGEGQISETFSSRFFPPKRFLVPELSLRARLWASEMDPAALATLTYQKLIEVAGQTDVEVELKKAA